jgi:transglutaminase-like putative cysteine protease/uncharacterized protein YnzC (UPF0291/DUF896 family)
MQYDNYEKRIKRVARVLSRIVRLLPIIIPTLCLIIAGISTLLAFKGRVGDITAPEQLTYGEAITCEADAFLSKVRYEYAKSPSGEWTESAPKLPGTYYVRAVGNGSFGTLKYSSEAKFTIVKKTVDVAPSSSVVYGETPTLEGELEYGDVLVCDSFEYEDILAEKTAVKPNASRVRVVDADGNDVTEAYVLNVSEGKVKILPRKITVTVEDSKRTYNGKRFTFDKYELTSGTTAEGDKLIAVLGKSITDVGSVKNTPTYIKVVTKEGRDATHKYDITQNIGMLTVEKRMVIVRTGSDTQTYDGNYRSYGIFWIDSTTPLAEGHYANATSETTVIDAGTYSNIIDIAIYNASGENKTYNHSIFYEEGTITIKKRVVTVKTNTQTHTYNGETYVGSVWGVLNMPSDDKWYLSDYTAVSDAGTYENRASVNIRDKYGRNVNNNYEFEEDFGTITVNKRSVTLRTDNYRAVYNGTEQKYWLGTVISEDTFASGDMFISLSGTAETDVIETYNCIYEYQVVRRAGGRDVTHNYDINIENTGTFVIYKRDITLRPNDVDIVYDGKYHAPTYVNTDKSSLISGHTVTAEMFGSRKNVGTTVTGIIEGSVVIKDASGKDVTSNYEIWTAMGRINISARPLYIHTGSASKVYDGTRLTNYEFTLGETTADSGLVSDHVINVLKSAFKNSITDVGTVNNELDVSAVLIVDENGENVTTNYLIEVTPGTLEVTQRYITVESLSAEKKYDGNPLTRYEWGIHDDSEYDLVEGHKLYVDIIGSQTRIGSSINTIDATETVIKDENGRIVTFNYYVSYVEGTLTVKPWATITVTTQSAQKEYDGTPLTNPEYTVELENEGDSIAPGHSYTVKVTGSQTEVGASPNYATFSILDANGKNARQFYTVKIVRGTLEVYESKRTQQTVALITTDRGGLVYLRQASYGVYNGTTDWLGTPAYGVLIDGKYNANYLTTFALKNSGASQRIARIKLLYESFMLPYYVGTEKTNPVPTYDTEYRNVSATEYEVSYYSLTSDALANIYSLRGNLGEYADYELRYREFVHKNYTDIPTDTRAYMDGIIAEQGFDVNDGAVIYKVASYIRNSAVYNLNYDRMLDESGDVAVEFLKTYKEGVCRHYATSATMLYRALGLPARYVVGYMVPTEAAAETEVTTPGHAWVEVYIDGVGWIQVEVTGSMTGDGEVAGEKIEIMPKYQSKKYDGTPLEAKNEIEIPPVLRELIKRGYTYEVTVRGMQTSVGIGESTITEFRLFDSDGYDVTENFRFDYKPGVLEVLPKDKTQITVFLYEVQKVYDGKELKLTDGDWEALDLGDGLTLELSINVSITNVGWVTLSEINGNRDKYITYTVRDASGTDVTDDYYIIFEASYADGTTYVPLRITKRAIELTAASQSKLYDGEILTNSKVSLTKGTLAAGHTLSAVARGGITNVGKEANVIDIMNVTITDASGNDVTNNYDISQISGWLEVIDPEE